MILEKDINRSIEFEREAIKIAQQFQQNRRIVKANANYIGLNADFLAWQEQITCVAPFLVSTPLPTAYAGQVENMNIADSRGRRITAQLQSRKYNAFNMSYLPLAVNEARRKGGNRPDAFIIPKNEQTNQQLILNPTIERGGTLSQQMITSQQVQRWDEVLRETSFIFAKRGIGKLKSTEIYEELRNDLRQALQQSSTGCNYDTFIEFFNKRLCKRIAVSQDMAPVPVDQVYYAPFLRDGIQNPGLFAQYLAVNNFFEVSKNKLLKICTENKVISLEVSDISDKDIELSDHTTNKTILFSEVVKGNRPFAPTKELAYLLCFGSFVPVIYGDQNEGSEVYVPYTQADRIITNTGLSSVRYEIQPSIPTNYNEQLTIFDFYADALYRN